MIDWLVDLVGRIGQWSYAVIFVAATLEASAFIGVVVPGDTVALLAGFLAYAGVLHLPGAILVAAAGAVLGDSLGYELGRRLGRPWLVRHGPRFGIRGPVVERLERVFARHGGKTILVARFVAVARSVAPFVAGSSRMPYGRFLAFNAAGAVLWATAFVLLGYGLGASWWLAERWIGRVGLVAAAVLAAVAFLVLRRRRRSASPGLP